MTRTEDAVGRLFGAAEPNRRTILTPEGVELPVEVAGAGERLVAFIIDFGIQLLATIVLFAAVGALVLSHIEPGVAVTAILFVAFLVRNLYFVYFETLWRGATPGKRVCGLRVVDRRGGSLDSGAVVARNLTREVEIFVPLGVMATVAASDGEGGFYMLAILVWMLLFSALPLFNRDRLRAGDLIAGTMVIALPRQRLLADVVEARADAFAFSAAQLAAYGAFELQVLEEVLRRPQGPGSEAMLAGVCERIVKKIGWTEPVPATQVRAFLNAFYAAERAHLERERLFGRMRMDKNA